MEKKKLYFSLYAKNELENDIEIVGQFDTIEELKNYFEISKAYLYKLGIKKTKNLKMNIKINEKEYELRVDKESE